MPINHHRHTPSGLPLPDPVSIEHQRTVEAFLIRKIESAPQGFMPFEQWMDLALYAPGLGYYTAGSAKFGTESLGGTPSGGVPSGEDQPNKALRSSSSPQGDFTTAPELSPLFGQTLARQIAQILSASHSVNVLEFGAGSGALAAAVIPALRQLGINPVYQILEVSADLRQRQQQRLSVFGPDVVWLDALPEEFCGCVLANEVLDAMPVTLFRWDATLSELGVSVRAPSSGAPATATEHSPLAGTPFILAGRAASPDLHATIARRMPPLPGYQSEINLRAEAWVCQMGSWLKQGAALLIDYGFPQREYYHPQRAAGTLMCHFRHHAHGEPLVYAGLQDITAHIDFTAMADAALAGGLNVMGYTSQARFLMNAGLPELLMQSQPTDSSLPQDGDDTALKTHSVASPAPANETDAREIAARNYQAMAAAQKLMSEAEMGELFKVLAIGRGLDGPLLGFKSGDRRHRL